LLEVDVRVPVAPVGCDGLSSVAVAAPLPPALELTSLRSVMPAGCVKLVASARLKTVSSRVLATVVLTEGATTLAELPVPPAETLTGVVPWTPP
jgi:hypothetical protein